MENLEKKTLDQELVDQIPVDQVKFTMESYGINPEELSEEEKEEYLKLKDRVWDLFVRYDGVWKGGVGNNEGNLPPLLLGPIGNFDYSSNRVDMIRVLDYGVCYGLFLDGGQPILAELQSDGHYKHKHLNKEEYKKVLKDMSDALDREEKRILAMEK